MWGEGFSSSVCTPVSIQQNSPRKTTSLAAASRISAGPGCSLTKPWTKDQACLGTLGPWAVGTALVFKGERETDVAIRRAITGHPCNSPSQWDVGIEAGGS